MSRSARSTCVPAAPSAPSCARPDGDEFDNCGYYLEIVPNEKLSWTSALGQNYRPASTEPAELQMTAVIELTRSSGGGAHYRAIATHNDVASRKRHEEMGFHDGWGTMLDQLVALVKDLP